MGIIGYARTCVGVERLQVLQVCKFRVHFHPGHLCQMEDGSQGISACSFGQGMSVQFVCFIVVVLFGYAGVNVAHTYQEYMPLAFAIANSCRKAGQR